ncbi:hypothetical protein DUNSADRAFT_7793 [Dunaliella salina]|uniref:Uncharacterized protein n=1 Tax=Dunaliella salina TaxID=3046 RepID=A0ABQ7GKN4_DUNSA|nr:hypothetical protein DUNSADRAFT_7793 [Dunaliella salina]|eukprot:KAF5835164.1 hypothetical protein DUNSADRAFT_7793 [Dunaliella salina]
MDAALARALQLTHQAAAAADTPTAGGKKQPASSAGPENSSLAGTPSVASSSSSSGSTAAVNGPDPALATDPRTPSPSETSSEHTSDGSKQPPVTSLTAAGYALILWSSARLHACSREGWSPLPGHASPQSKPLMHQSLGAHPATATAQTAPLSSSPPLTPMPSPVAVPLPWLASFLAASSAVCLLDSPDAEPQHASMVLWALGSLAMHGVAPQHTPQPSTTSIFTPSPSTSGHSLSSPSYSQSQPEVSLLLASAVPQQAQHQHQLPTLYPPNARPAGARTPGSLSTPSQHGQQHQHQHHQHQLQQQVALLGKQWNRGVDAVLECAARWGPALGPQGVANSLWGAARLHQHQQQQQQQQVQQQLWQPQITSWPPDALQDSASQQQQQQQQQWQQEQQHESSTVDAGAQRWGLQGNDWDTGAGGAALQEGQQQHRRQQQQVYYQQAQQQQQQQQSQLQFSWRRRHAPQLRALLHACEDVLPKMEPQHMANTAWAAAVLQPAPAPSPPWMQQLLHYLRPELYHLPPQGIATVLWACARMGCRPSIEWMLVLVRGPAQSR